MIRKLGADVSVRQAARPMTGAGRRRRVQFVERKVRVRPALEAVDSPVLLQVGDFRILGQVRNGLYPVGTFQ